MIKNNFFKLNFFVFIVLLFFIIEGCANSTGTELSNDNLNDNNKAITIENFDKYYAICPSSLKEISSDGTVQYLSGPLLGIKNDGTYEQLFIVERNKIKNIITPYTYYQGNMLFFADDRVTGGYDKTIFVNIGNKNILDMSTGTIYKTDKNMEFVYANPFTNSCFYVGTEENKSGVFLLTFENREMVSTFLYDCGSYGYVEGGPSFVSDRYNNVLQIQDRNFNHYLIDKTGYILDVNDNIEINYDYGVFVKQNTHFLNKEGQWEKIENLKLLEPILSENVKNTNTMFNCKLKWKLDGYEEKSDKELSKVLFNITNDNALEKVEDKIIITNENPFEYKVSKQNYILLTLGNNCKSPVYISGVCYYYDENDFSIKSIDVDSKDIKTIDSLNNEQFLLSEGVILQVIDSDYYSVSVKDRRLQTIVRLYDKNGIVNSISEKTEISINTEHIYTVNKIPASQLGGVR